MRRARRSWQCWLRAAVWCCEHGPHHFVHMCSSTCACIWDTCWALSKHATPCANTYPAVQLAASCNLFLSYCKLVHLNVLQELEENADYVEREDEFDWATPVSGRGLPSCCKLQVQQGIQLPVTRWLGLTVCVLVKPRVQSDQPACVAGDSQVIVVRAVFGSCAKPFANGPACNGHHCGCSWSRPWS